MTTTLPAPLDAPTTGDPYAIVRPGGVAQQGLLALGWTVTDPMDGWDHMEPPALGAESKVLVVSGPTGMAHASSVKVKSGDGLIVTADVPEDERWMLTEQVELMLRGELDVVVVPYEVKVTVLESSGF